MNEYEVYVTSEGFVGWLMAKNEPEAIKEAAKQWEVSEDMVRVIEVGTIAELSQGRLDQGDYQSSFGKSDKIGDSVDTKVSYQDPTFAAIVYDFDGMEYRFHFHRGEWFVQLYWYAQAHLVENPEDFFRSEQSSFGTVWE